MKNRFTQLLVGGAFVLVIHTSAHSALVLNEALANEPGPTTTLEWVEILNWPDTGQLISLTGYKYIDGGQSVSIDTNITIPAGGFAVLARKATGASSFEERWGNASGVWGDHASELYPLVAISQMSLRNSSDTIRLVSPSGDTSTIFWTSDSGDGISWERIRPGSCDAVTLFAPCRAATRSTPGEQNSVLPPSGELRLDSLRVITEGPEWGDPVHLQVVLTNIGFGSVSGVTLSIVRIIGSDSLQIAQVGIPSISEEVTQIVDYIWPDPPPGISHLVAIIESDADASNNSDTATVTVRFTQPLLIISEYLANPEVGGPDEWVEIHNAADFPISLEGLRIGDMLNSDLIPRETSPIGPGEFSVLVENEAAFRAHYPDVTAPVIRIPGWRSLNNSGDGIRLLGPSDEIIDSLTFRTLYSGNRSVERVELDPSFAPPVDWTSSVDPEGATPGDSNSVVRGHPGFILLDSVWAAPANVTPDVLTIYASITNFGFGPSFARDLILGLSLDPSSPDLINDTIGDASIPVLVEGQTLIISYDWDSPPPGIQRIVVWTTNDDGSMMQPPGVVVTTVPFTKPLIIISEYMAASGPAGPGEWIELYNASDISLSLRGVLIGDADGLTSLPPPFPNLDPGGFLIVTQDEGRFRSFYQHFTGELRTLSGWRSLTDNGDRIRLIGPSNEIIDSVSYGVKSGMSVSTERRQLVTEFANPRDWGESVDLLGATPGNPNSIRRLTRDLSLDSVVVDILYPFESGDISLVFWITNRGFESVDGAILASDLSPGYPYPVELTLGNIPPGESQEYSYGQEGVEGGWRSVRAWLSLDDDPSNSSDSTSFMIQFTYPPLLVSEYLANPHPGGPGEWIEVFNWRDSPVTVSGFSLGDASDTIRWATLDKWNLQVMPSHAYWVLANDESAFRAFYPEFSGTLIEVAGWPTLNDGGDIIRIFGPSGELSDSTQYSTVFSDNHSAERTVLETTVPAAGLWTVSVDPVGATPGRANSVSATSAGMLQVDVTPNPAFRSAGQTARIDYRLEIGESLTLKIYDRAGRLVRTFADESPSATGFVEWNGTDDAGYQLRPGPYVLLARSEPAGSVKKMVVVIAP